MLKVNLASDYPFALGSIQIRCSHGVSEWIVVSSDDKPFPE